MPSGRPERSFVAKFPSVATTFGWISSICFHRWLSQAWISSGSGSRLPGGRHFNVFATNTSLRVSPIPASSVSSSFPACPTNGTPCLSSWKPGASPTNIRSAWGCPDPKTTCVRPSASRHFVQPAIESAKTASPSIAPESNAAAGRSVPAAAGTAATATAAQRGTALDAVGGEHRELLADVLRAAIGAISRFAHRHELLVVGLAFHADELVNRHPAANSTESLEGVNRPCPPQVSRLSGIYMVRNRSDTPSSNPHKEQNRCARSSSWLSWCSWPSRLRSPRTPQAQPPPTPSVSSSGSRSAWRRSSCSTAATTPTANASRRPRPQRPRTPRMRPSCAQPSAPVRRSPTSMAARRSLSSTERAPTATTPSASASPARPRRSSRSSSRPRSTRRRRARPSAQRIRPRSPRSTAATPTPSENASPGQRRRTRKSFATEGRALHVPHRPGRGAWRAPPLPYTSGTMAPAFLRRADDDKAFERLYERHVRDVYRYAAAMLGTAADAEDVTQTTFLNAYRAFKKGTRPDKPQSWLIAIAHNVCRQRFRQAQRRPHEVAFDERIGDGEPAEEITAPSAEDLRRALSQLPPNQRAAVVMRELEGSSYAEIAEVLGISVSALETLLFRARRALREQLEEQLTCQEAAFAINKQVDGRLSLGERRALRAHLRACAECNSLAQSQRAQRRALKALVLVPLPATVSHWMGGQNAAAATGAGGTGGLTAVGAATGGGTAGASSVVFGGVAAKVAAVVGAGVVVGGGTYEGVTRSAQHK